MPSSPITKCGFLRTMTAGAAGVVLGRPQVSRATRAGVLSIDEPFHGAVLNHRHGRLTADGLKIPVTGRVSVNGQSTKRKGTS